MQVVTSKTRGSKSYGSNSKLSESQVGKPKLTALAKLNTNHQMGYQTWQLQVGKKSQDTVSKTGKLNGQRNKNHFQMLAMLSKQ
jgi:hypothetical protein